MVNVVLGFRGNALHSGQSVIAVRSRSKRCASVCAETPELLSVSFDPSLLRSAGPSPPLESECNVSAKPQSIGAVTRTAETGAAFYRPEVLQAMQTNPLTGRRSREVPRRR